MDRPRKSQPVDRRILLATDLVTVRDNVCTREDPALSDETPPLPFHELCIPLSGVWVLRDGPRAAPFVPGSAHLLTRGFTYRAEHPCGCGDDRNLGIALDDAALTDMRLDGPRSMRSGASLNDRQIAAAWALARGLRVDTVDPLAAEEASLACANALVPRRSEVSSPARSAATRRSHAQLVDRVEQVLASRCADSLTLAQIARSAHASPFHMSRVFRAITGRTISGRLRSIRLAHAMEQLVDTDDTVQAVACRTGFTDAPHLVRTLRASLGMTPDRFRRGCSRDLLRHARLALGVPLQN